MGGLNFAAALVLNMDFYQIILDDDDQKISALVLS
jgi:hypothetical protein